MQPDKPKKFQMLTFPQILLVVCIFAILAAILFPVYTGNGHSPKTSCISNLKQLSLAVMIYTGDHDDSWPIDYSFDGPEKQTKFVDATLPYLKNKEIYLCPQEQRDIKDKGLTNGLEGISGTMDYVHCLSLRGLIPEFSTGKRVLVEKDVAEPAKTPYLRDPIRGYGTAKDNNVVGFLSPHGGGFVTAYFDSHVRYIKSPNINSDL